MATSREPSIDAKVFRARIAFAANTIATFWMTIFAGLPIASYIAWKAFARGNGWRGNGVLIAALAAVWVAIISILIPGRALAMWPYAVTLEPKRGMWVNAPPRKIWVPLDEIVDIDVYSGVYGDGHVVQLSRAHGLAKQIYFTSLFFPHDDLVRELRAAIDERDGVVFSR